MGYHMSIMYADFRISQENHASALQAIKDLAGKETIKDSSGPHFSWVDTDEFLEATSLKEALSAWRWEVEYDNLIKHIISIEFWGEKLGDESILFNAIAPYIDDGSYIQMQGEDGDIWRWVFKNGEFKEIMGKVSFEEDLD